MPNTTAVAARDGATRFDPDEVITTDQATSAEFARYPVAGEPEATAAVAAAREASRRWWKIGFDGRADRLRAWQREIALAGEEAASLIHAENGKPLEDARVEVLSMLGNIQYALANVERVLGTREVAVGPITPNQRAWVEYQPYGVVGVIGPWNFPLGTPGGLVVSALAAGNAVVMKPSHITPGVLVWLAEAWRRAVPDLPDVLQVLNGYGATGQALIAAGPDKIAFTGSAASGRAVAAQCAQSLIPVLLELGGKDGVIVAADADLDDAARHVVWGAMQNTGLGCISLEVAYVVESVYDDFVDKVSALAADLRVGSDDDAQIGPVPLPAQIDTIRAHIQDALDRGATAKVGGIQTVSSGRYVSPTVLADVPIGALVEQEETFGPTLAIVRVRDTDEAVARINASQYGLGGAVFSEAHGEEIARGIRTGMTSINDALTFSMNPELPFGGRGSSGYGRKQGDEGFREFAHPHSFTAKTGPASQPPSAFGRPAGAMRAALAGARDRAVAEAEQESKVD